MAQLAIKRDETIFFLAARKEVGEVGDLQKGLPSAMGKSEDHHFGGHGNEPLTNSQLQK